MSVFSDILTMTIYRPPTCHIQPAPLPTFPQPCLFGYTSAVLSVLWAVNFIHSPNGVLREAFQGVTLSFHFSDYQLSWCAFSYCTPVTAFVTFSSCFIAVTYRSRILSIHVLQEQLRRDFHRITCIQMKHMKLSAIMRTEMN